MVDLEKYWQDYLKTLTEPADAETRFFGSFQIGDSKASADEGARLVLQGLKTATSSLIWEYEGSDVEAPRIGSLSILLDGDGEPVCIVETTQLLERPFMEIEESFAVAYGEWDRTLESWRTHCWNYYARRAGRLGRTPTRQMVLLCEWFSVVFPCQKMNE